MANQIISSFLDGFTGGSLFARLSRPGAPTQVFADEESEYPQAELVASLLKSELNEAGNEQEETSVSIGPAQLDSTPWRGHYLVHRPVGSKEMTVTVKIGDSYEPALAAFTEAELAAELEAELGQQGVETVKKTIHRILARARAEHGS